MTKKLAEAYERWWRREVNAGLGLSDTFEVACIEAVARAAYEAGARKQRVFCAEKQP